MLISEKMAHIESQIKALIAKLTKVEILATVGLVLREIFDFYVTHNIGA